MKRSEFVFDSVDLSYYQLQKISLKRCGSYVGSPKWLKNKTTTKNPKNNDNNCIQYALTAALNHKQIKSHLERISKIRAFIEQHDWEEIDFPAQQENWKKFELNNK